MAHGEQAGNGVTAAFWGTNSLVIRDEKTTILVDPYFTRVSKRSLVFGKIRSNPEIIARTLKQAGVEKADAILVTHTHFDHALDLAEAARMTGAVVWGSESTANVCRGGTLPEGQIRVVQPGQGIRIGGFEVAFVPGKHLAFPRLLALLFRNAHAVTAPLPQPAKASAYGEGGCFSLYFKHPAGAFINQGSANWVEGSLDGYPADAALLGVGGLDLHGPEYWDNWFRHTVGATGAKTIYLTHWDDFSLPLDQPPRYLRKVEKAIRHILARSGAASIQQMPWKQAIRLL